MAEIATDVAKRVTYKYLTSSWGTLGGAGSAQVLRHVSSDFNLRKAALRSAEKRSDYQRSDLRHGLGMVGGRVAGELSPGTWQDFFVAICRQAFQAAVTTGNLTNVTAAATTPHFARASGSFLTDGFKVGDIVRWTGFAGGSAPNNNSRNFLITALTATDMTGIFLDGSSVVADASGDTVVCTQVGKKTHMPLTGHIDPHFDFEHWHADISQSEVYDGCKLNNMAIGLDASRIASIDLDFLGRSMTEGTAAYHTSPTDETETGLLSPATGFIYVGGTQVALLTGLSFGVAANMAAADRVVGATRPAQIFEGEMAVTGQLSAYFQDAALRDLFFDETEFSVYCVFAESTAATAGFVSFVMPRCKALSADKGGAPGLELSIPFEALLNHSGGSGTSSLETTISIQDSAAS